MTETVKKKREKEKREEGEERRKVFLTNCTHFILVVSVLLCLSASPIAAAPLAPMLLR
jgi:hypothetical protein